MTSHDDPTETLLAESLDRQAAQAPLDDDLLNRVHARLHRRRSGRTTGAVVVACATVAAGIFGVHSMLEPTAIPASQLSPGDTAGWHWESYKTVQVKVPDSWTHYASGSPACSDASDLPTIGRLDDWTDPAKTPCTVPLAAQTKREYLWFGDVPQTRITRQFNGSITETRLVSGVQLTVRAQDPELRRQILDSAVPIGSTDHYGCLPRDPLGASPNVSPAPVGNKDTLGTVESVDICEYWTGPLIASSRLTGTNARALAQGLADAAGVLVRPTPPAGCVTATSLPGYGYGNNRIRSYRLTIHGSGGQWQGWLRYTSCYKGLYPFNDGNTVDLASSETVALVRSGPHAPTPPTRFINTGGEPTAPHS